ncbi:MAG TPA: redox-sensing transcriptional repressor Rex [Candidatus Hydrogenedentes bacterium]|nr:redox-sensing transcriptional repressor Rex [Candidatus Hydrogenedentota bacterium]HQE82284.1 redox-sensing transcriptional repressor Rex [Candidatus Hydrogenedentota bacterium]HQH51562.1 redox-sensing transcriptional repressor Rex [Candidatus Hydrogenedentota bacterium]HQM48818.1 redox-sensing transcriptional repressor Rex [Candidatus Hydrogenedentota bacterium]
MISDKTVARLSVYRRVLLDMQDAGQAHVFSHELASKSGCTAAQVRRDVMATGYTGSPVRGYDVAALGASISEFLSHADAQRVALVGIGNLGRALMAFSPRQNPRIPIVAAFDNDPAKVNRVIHGCRCYPVQQLEEIVEREGIRIGIIAVPAAAAQDVARRLCRAGVVGLLNFAPTHVWVPPHVYIENLDLSMSLEKVAFFAGQQAAEKEINS